jgi:hypothetical protein
MIVETGESAYPVLVETLAEDEGQIQELVKANPDLLAIEEFGLQGPLLVVGRESTVASGSIDLAAVARGGELLVIEFKTGPQNSDFRHAIAQLLDYGSFLWSQTLHQFESAVAVRFFVSERCTDQRLRGRASLRDAAFAVWPDMSDQEWEGFQNRLAQQLTDGTFHYVLVAQRFTSTMERTITYMNHALSSSRMYGVELVRFVGSGLSAFESRTVLKPEIKVQSSITLTNRSRFLDQIADDDYRSALEDFLDRCQLVGLRFEWGTKGVSIRCPNSYRREPLTVAWLFPPGVSGWYGLTDVTAGYDASSAEQLKGADAVLNQYSIGLAAVPGGTQVAVGKVKAVRLSADRFVAVRSQLEDLLESVFIRLNEGTPVLDAPSS